MNVMPTLRLQVFELDLHRLSQLEIEGPQRLVEEQDLGLVDQGAGQCHPLLHAARELIRPGVGPLGELDLVEYTVHTAPDLRLLDLLHVEPECDVLRNRHMGKEGV